MMNKYDIAKEFRIQANHDFNCADCLLRSEKDWAYGNSAYLYQQGIEKSIKSAMVECNMTVKTMKSLRHVPLVELWNNLLCRIDVMALNTQDQAIVYKNASTLTYILKQFFEDSIGRLKTVWWKTSLGINLLPAEINKIQVSNGFEVAATQIKVLKVDLDNSDASKSLPKLNSKMARNKFKNMIDNLDAIEIDKIPKEVNKDSNAIEHLMSAVLKSIEPLANIIQTSQQNIPASDYSLLKFLLWALKSSIPILKITPHEVFGRYPTVVDNKSTITWYIENHDRIVNLGQELKSIHKELLYTLHPNFRARSWKLG